MAVYVEDWSGHDLGAGVPAGWTARWNTVAPSYTVQVDPDAPGGKSLRVLHSSGAKSMLNMDGIPETTLEIDIRALVRLKVKAPGTYGGLIARARGLAANAIGTQGGVGLSGSPAQTVLRRTNHHGAGGTHTNEDSPTLGAWVDNGLYWLRLTCSGTDALLRLNSHELPDGTPLASVGLPAQPVDVALLRAGISTFASTTDIDFLWWGAGTGADEAPLPDGWGDDEAPEGVPTITDVSASPSSAVVTYSYAEDDAAGFEYRIDGGIPAIIGPSPATVTGLTQGTTYDNPGIQVRAVNSAGEGEWSVAVPLITTVLSPIVIHADFERSGVDPSLSEVVLDADDVVLVKLQARRQTTATSINRWIEPVAKITGANGQQPRIEIVPYLNGGYHNNANNQPWITGMRGHYSYDGKSWTPFDNLTRVDRLLWSNSSPFTQDEVWIARSPITSVTDCGEWIESLLADYPNKVRPSQTAIAFTPLTTTGFPAQSCIAAEIVGIPDELGRPVPDTPFYAFEISEGSSQEPVILSAGIHASEDIGDLILREIVRWLLGESQEAATLRAKYRWLVYPLLNPLGRWAGYWRGAPGSTVDPNRDFASSPPAHQFTQVNKDVTLADLNGKEPWWGISLHATVSGGRLQVGARNQQPLTVDFYNRIRANYASGDWSVYGDIDANPPLGSNTQQFWWENTAGMKMSVLVEGSDQAGPVSPSNIAPYADAIGDALFSMDQEGLFYQTGSEGGSSAEVTVTVQGAGVAQEHAAGGTTASVAVNAWGQGVAAEHSMGSSTAQVVVSATGAGQASGSDQGGSSARVTVSATGAGAAVEVAQGGSTAQVSVSAQGAGFAGSDQAGGSTATVTVSATSAGTGHEVVEGGSTASVSVSAQGSGIPSTGQSGGSTSNVIVLATGQGFAREHAAGGSSAGIKVAASGAGESSEGQAGEGGSTAQILVFPSGSGVAIERAEGGSTAQVWVRALGTEDLSFNGPAILLEIRGEGRVAASGG